MTPEDRLLSYLVELPSPEYRRWLSLAEVPVENVQESSESGAATSITPASSRQTMTSAPVRGSGKAVRFSCRLFSALSIRPMKSWLTS